jgi:hypothetical protein
MASLDPSYKTNMEKKIDNISTCEELSLIKHDVEENMAALVAKVAGSISDLSDLLVKPDDLGKIVTWIGKFIDKSVTGPYNKLLALQTEVLALQTAMNAKIAAKIAELHCSI